MEVLEHNLWLILRPAQRSSTQRSSRTNFQISNSRYLTLVHGWGTRERGLTLAQLASSDTSIPPEATTVHYQFYRHLGPGEVAQDDKKPLDTPNTTPTKSKGKEKESSSAAQAVSEGLIVVSLSDIDKPEQSISSIFGDAVDSHLVPEEHQYELMHKIRIARSIQDPKKRQQLLKIRLLAIAIMGHVVQESIANSDFFFYEPDIVSQIAELLHPDKSVPIDVQASAFYALDGLGRYRGKLMEILTALGAAANHGILLAVMRNVASHMNSDDDELSPSYIDGLFTLLGYIVTTQHGGTMVVTAGIVPILTQLIKVEGTRQYRNVNRMLGILISLTNGFATAFTAFCQASGIEILTNRIDLEMSRSISDASPKGSPGTEGSIPFGQSLLIKGMLKFVWNMMSTSGTAEGLRNLIDTKLPICLRLILSHGATFSASIYAHAINIMATFIHNEPTSLPILQENQLPQTFLDSMSRSIPPSMDVISAIPNALGAICLNSQGIEAFRAAKPIPALFGTLISAEHLRCMHSHENDGVSGLGTSIDELMRHHPSLKGDVMEALIDTIQRVIEIGRNTAALGTVDQQNAALSSSIDAQDPKSDDSNPPRDHERNDPNIVAYIENISRFLESLFQNASHCKDFIRRDGLDTLLEIYSLPTLPYDFATTSAANWMCHALQVTSEVDSQTVVPKILKRLEQAIADAEDFVECQGAPISSQLLKADHLASGNKTYRSLVTLHGYISLLAEIYHTLIFSHSKSALAFVQALNDNSETSLLSALGRLYRSCVWEKVLLLHEMPKEWNAKEWTEIQNKARRSSMIGKPSSSESTNEDMKIDEDDAQRQPKPDENVHVNFKLIKFLLSSIPTDLTKFWQGVVKMLLPRRSADPAHKKQALGVAKGIATTLFESFNYTRAMKEEVNANNRLGFLSVMLGLISVIMLEERPSKNLHTIIVLAFDRLGGFEQLFTQIEALWAEAASIDAIPEAERDFDVKTRLLHVYSGLKTTLHIVQHISSSKVFLESQHTTSLISKDKSRGDEDYFQPNEFLAIFRNRLTPSIRKISESNALLHMPISIARSVVLILNHVFKGDGEEVQITETPSTSGSALLAGESVFGSGPLSGFGLASSSRTPAAPDENSIQQLCDMGFPRQAAIFALNRVGNRVSAAAEYLLANPGFIAVAEHSDRTTPTGVPNERITSDPASTDVPATSAPSVTDTDAAMNTDDPPQVPPKDIDSKGKEKADGALSYDEARTALGAFREEASLKIGHRAIVIADNHEDIILDVRDLILCLVDHQLKDKYEFLLHNILPPAQNTTLSAEAVKSLGVRLKLLALLWSQRLPKEGSCADIVTECFGLMKQEAMEPVANELPAWIASLLLIFETLLSATDEPVSIAVEHGKEKQENQTDKVLKLTEEQRNSTFHICFKLLEREKPSKDSCIAVLRLLVRLTRHRDLVARFMSQQGLSKLTSFSQSVNAPFQGYQIYFIMIMRHIIENTDTVAKIMEREISNWFAAPRGRVSDVSSYLRNNSQLALRDHTAFIQATEKLCKLKGFESSTETFTQITLKMLPKESSKAEVKDSEKMVVGTSQESETKEDAGHTEEQSNPFETPKKPVSSDFDEVIQFLASELMAIRFNRFATKGSDGDTKMADADSSDKNEFKPLEQKDYLYRCFILQCLTELLSSYMSCKLDVLSLIRRKAMTPGAVTKPRVAFLNHLLNDLIPYGCITPSNDLDVRKRVGQSNWAMSVLVALCASTGETDDDDKKLQNDLLTVRKFVLDGITKAFKDASTSTEPIESKYGRLWALSEVCHRLLTARANTSSGATKNGDDMSTSILKLMLEKNFVAIFTSAVSDVDLNYPSAKDLVNSLLRPLEFLTRGAIKMGRSAEPSKDPHEMEILDEFDEYYDDEEGYEYDEEEESDREETPDLYRNSALGMYEGNLDQHNHDEEMGTTEEEEMYDEVDYDEEESGSDVSDPSDDDDDDEDDDDDDDGSEEDAEMDVQIVLHDDELDAEDDEDSEDMDSEEHDHMHHEYDSEHIDDDDPISPGPGIDMGEEPLIHLDVDVNISDMLNPLGGHHHLHHHHHHHEDGDRDLVLIGDEEDEDDEEDDDEDDDIEDAEGNQLIVEPPVIVDGDMGNRFGMNWGWSRSDGAGHRSSGIDGELGRPMRQYITMHQGARRHRHYRYWPNDEETDFQIFGRNRPMNAVDDFSTHPLLANRDGPSSGVANADTPLEVQRNRITGGRSNAWSDWVQSIEELIGGSAVQLLERLLNRNRNGGPAHVEMEISNGAPNGFAAGVGMDRGVYRQQQQSSSRPSMANDPVSIVQDFVPVTTIQRWFDEARLMYGSTSSEKAARLMNFILNALAPAALEEERKLKEEEAKKEAERKAKAEADRIKTEEERRKVEEEMKAKAEEQARKDAEEAEVRRQEAEQARELARSLAQNVLGGQATAESMSAAAPMEGVEGTSEATGSTGEAQGTAEANQPAARTTIRVHGREVDITDTGIDPDFLEALPDDLREEVINQHFREQREATGTNATTQPHIETEISNEFLEALPPEIRAEVIQQEAISQRQRELAQRRNAADDGEGGPVDIDPASFLASLDPQLRQAVLVEQDDLFLSTLPPAMAAEANSYRDRIFSRHPRGHSHSHGYGHVRGRAAADQGPSIGSKKSSHRDTVQLLDRTGLATLVRLLFLPQPLQKNMLHRVLLNVCENSKNRVELLGLVLSILQDGSVDLAAVDKSFAQMSLRPKVQTPKQTSKKSFGGSVSSVAESAPNLVAQRCIEALTYIVTYNEQSVNYFMTEHEQVIGLKRTSSKKGKGKELKPNTSKYPLVVLLSLLDREVFLSNVSIMEQFTNLLSTVTRPLAAKKDEDKADKGKAKDTGSSTAGAASTIDLNAAAATATDSASATTASAAPADEVMVIDTTPATKADDAQPSDTKDSSKDKTKKEIPLPNVPQHELALVVNILTAGECTSKTFQHTLALIQHLSQLAGARETIANELVQQAQIFGRDIIADLSQLGTNLKAQSSSSDLPTSSLAKFSAASSLQAKLLRILKTIDYMYSRKQSAAMDASPTEIALAPTVDPDEPNALQGNALTSKDNAVVLSEDEEKVLQIYEGLQFRPLWQHLGECLAVVHENNDMIHVATVLLPLVESLMVVCKYIGTKPMISRSVRGSVSPHSQDSMDDMFMNFTESHRKILNIMVRNNPTLMSGSFSLLVHNPKMLEFDNKRNYFNQQLHKRTNAREHYPTLALSVHRNDVLRDSFRKLLHRSGDEIKYGKLSIRFYEEEGVDAGGLTREWFQVLTRQMFDPNYALFTPCASDKLTYQPNRTSWVNDDHLSYFKFIGRVIGKAIYDGRLLDAYFTRSFYKHILGKAVDYRDIEAVDPEYYKSLEWMLHNDITDIIDLTFSVEAEDYGQKKIIDLKPDGRNIPVTEENKQEYVKLITESKLTTAIKDQISSFLAGFHDIIPPQLIRIFTEKEMELLISGLPDIDIDDWKNHTEYQNYTQSSPQVQWFWRAIRSFDQEERAKVIQFVTGTSKVPLEGFGHLQGVNGTQRFQIHKDFSSTDRLPSAHTCFNQIDLPEYESYEVLRSRILTAISEGAEGFGFS